jgi:hypothetical protein
VEEPSLGVQLIGHAGYVLLISASLVRAILPLRLLAVGAGVFSICYGIAIASRVEVFWESVFTVVNAVQAIILIREKHGIQLTNEEASLQAAVFPHMSKLDFHRLIRAGGWRSDGSGVEYTSHGKHVERIVLMSDGVADVIVDGATVAHCRRGDFVGEMAFLSGAPATATVKTGTETRALAWEFAALKDVLQKHADLGAAVQVVFNRNLIGKLIEQRNRNVNEDASAVAGGDPAPAPAAH